MPTNGALSLELPRAPFEGTGGAGGKALRRLRPSLTHNPGVSDLVHAHPRTRQRTTSRPLLILGDKTPPEGALLNRPGTPDVDELEELGSRPCIAAEGAHHSTGHHGDAPLVDAARSHALVDRVDHDADAAGF
jgi:hypothetical protein